MLRLRSVGVAVFILTLAACGPTPGGTPEKTIVEITVISKSCVGVLMLDAYVWLDENENGMWDEGEHPLPGVSVRATGGGLSLRRITSEDGLAAFQDTIGCDSGGFQVSAELLPGYRFTTAPAVYSPQSAAREDIHFGVVREDSDATPASASETSAGPPDCTRIGQTWTRPADDMIMVCVPAGEFLMGSSDKDIDAVIAECSACDREWFADEKPQHMVFLDAFWIDRTEVTNAQYRLCVEDSDCAEPAGWDDGDRNVPNQPVVWVSWHDAQAYAAWAGGRLPSEAEWEKAASWNEETGEQRVYPWGDSFDGTPLNLCDVNCRCGYSSVDDGYALTAPVGSYPAGASPCGALDMAGNVSEWVADWYAEYSSGRMVNPMDLPRGRTAHGVAGPGIGPFHMDAVRPAPRDCRSPV